MKAEITLSANAGVMIEYAGIKVLSDILHNDNVPVFSSVPKYICKSITDKGAFSGAELFLVSHDHPDHYSRPLASEYMKNNKNTVAAAPFRFAERQIVFSGVTGKFKTFNTMVEYFRTPHEKQRVYADVKHYSYIVNIAGAKFAFFNDMSIEPEYMEQVLRGSCVDVAFINFPWITLKHGRKYLAEYLRAKNIVIYHLPIPVEDEYGYNAAEQKSLASLSLAETAVYTLNSPLMSIETEL